MWSRRPGASASAVGSWTNASSSARARNYRTLTLWTNDILASARRIYEEAGFRLVAQENHHSFGKDLVGQNWELDLRQGARKAG